MKSSTRTKASEIKREWHLVDLKGQTLGRISTEIAHILMGKSKTNFVRHLDMGDYVVAINAKEIKVTGKKDENKKYYRHSGYPGGFRAESFREVMIKNPGEVVRHAVSGMLPQNRLRDRMLKRLKLFNDSKHTFEDKFKPKAEK
jgi:large subunit ribosomal protein L13